MRPSLREEVTARRTRRVRSCIVAAALVALGVLALAGPAGISAQVSSDVLTRSVVLVAARRDGVNYAASGFAWKHNNVVGIVTALHAVSGELSVVCQGVSRRATVSKMLADADLAFLTPASPFTNCPAFPSQIQRNKPAEDTVLRVLGYTGGTAIVKTRNTTKLYSSQETLQGILFEPVLSEQRRFQIPALTLDIYYVQGGLLPGFSGGPVVNPMTGDLVAIVDGGLDKGTSDYNWVIPATKIGALLDSTETRLPPQLAAGGPAHFRSPTVESPEMLAALDLDRPNASPNAPVVARPIVVPTRATRAALTFNQNGWQYHYVLTKTQSLAELASTSDDPAGLMRLLQVYGPLVGPDAPSRLRFDIYQEVDRDLIIAVPAGQPLQFGSPQPGFWLLTSEPANRSASAQFEERRFSDGRGRPVDDEYGVMRASDGSGAVRASDPRYFNEQVAEILGECNVPNSSTCSLDPASLRSIDLGGGSKILKFGLNVNYPGPNPSSDYRYYTYAVMGTRVFRAYTQLFDRDGGLVRCARPGAAGCAASEMAFTQLSQLVAVHLTTFAGVVGQAGQPTLETRFTYDSRLDNPTTLHVGYYVGGDLRLYNTNGRVWTVVESPTRDLVFTERRRDATNVYLLNGDTWLRVPINGGPYATSTDGQATWRPVGVLQRGAPR